MRLNKFSGFLLTRLLRGVTYFLLNRFKSVWFLLTRLLRGVTVTADAGGGHFGVSTHTPLARRDKFGILTNGIIYVSTHTPLARRDYPL